MGMEDTLRKEYRIRFNSVGRKSLIVAFPYEVAEREARRLGMSMAEFVERYQAVAQYDSIDGVHYTFEPIPD